MFQKILNIILNLFLTLASAISLCQNIPLGQWNDHLPYSDAVSVTYGNKTVYCATTSAVFTYDKEDLSLEKLNLINGLSDIGITKIKYCDLNSRVIITYENGNIDIINEDKSITNIPYIKNSKILGEKRINDIFIQDYLAYLSTGFGIVVLNTEKLEISDTYLIGPLGKFITTNAVTTNSQYIYAATEEGVFLADKYSPNLSDYNEWSRISELGEINYSSVVSFSDRIFASSNIPGWKGDSIYYNNNDTWQIFSPDGYSITDLFISNNKLIVNKERGILIYSNNLTLEENIYTINNNASISPKEAIIDEENIIWYADYKYGLIRAIDNWKVEIITPNGPSSRGCLAMDLVDNNLWVVSGGFGTKQYEKLINHRSNSSWWSLLEEKIIINQTTTEEDLFVADLVSVAVNPTNPTNVYAGSWRDGLIEFNNEKVTNIHTSKNSLIDSAFFGIHAIGAIKFDTDNNLWITSSYSQSPLTVKTSDNKWFNFSFPGKTANTSEYLNILIDDNNNKWLPLSNRIIVFNENKTFDNKSDDQSTLLTSDKNKIPGSAIKSIALDADGEVWIGTDEGISVFYNPSEVFDEDITAEQIFIQQEGQTQILLETETVTVITIDGANRKWIGTQNSGVFLISEDGTEQIEHFTKENSPLFSNNILSIVIDEKSGEVYIGTQNGLISYKGTATESSQNYDNIIVYPNPVKPDFTGKIAIKGLINDTDVKITDIAGNIVFQTTSLGGQAIWDGKDYHGNKVQSGVYLIFNNSPGGTKKAAAKILFLN